MAFVGIGSSAEASQPGVHVEILGIRNSIGAVACALFEAPEGFPSEFLRFGYGFSNDAKGTLGAPSFEAASFSYNGESLDMTIALQY